MSTMLTQSNRVDAIQRRGSAYVLVLGVALLVFVIGVGSMAIVSAQVRANAGSADLAEARLYALSAVDLGRLMIAQDPNWRTTHANGIWISNQAIGSGSCSLDVVNPNGPLDQSETDPVVLTGTGVKGQARHKTQVTLVDSKTPLPCLRDALVAGGGMQFTSSQVNPLTQTLACNGNMSANGSSSIHADVEAAGAITGGSYMGTKKPGSQARLLPDATAFDFYIANGTVITASALSSGHRIENALLSPEANPYGPVNARGIYVIEGQGEAIEIENSRVIGTLVILNPGAGTIINADAHLAPAISNYPCLMVRGNITIDMDSTDLSEVDLTVNFNPDGSPYPYPDGAANATLTDRYRCGLHGLVYVSGNLMVSDDAVFGNVIVGGTFTSKDSLTFNPDAALSDNPPFGFFTIPTPVLSGSWKQAVN